MQMTQLITRLGRNDVKLIRRDSFLLFMFAFVLVIATVLRFGMPALNDYLRDNNVLNETTAIPSLEAIYPMIVAYMTLYTGALLVGTIFGFMLLDEKDDSTIKAMLVAPISMNQYLTYRVGMPVFIAFVVILFQFLFINQALVPLWQIMTLAAGASLTAPIVSLFFATFAANKVQGFALSKFGGVAGWTVMLGWFVPMPLQLVIGVFPPFWMSKAYWMILEGNALWWVAFIIGVVTQLVLIAVLMRRFETAAYQS